MPVPTLILLLLGVLLLIVEMFLPGFGVAGVAGLLSLFGALLLQIGNPVGMLFMGALVLFIIAVVLIIFFRFAQKGKFDKWRLILGEHIEGKSTSIKNGQYKEYLGAKGRALTQLRPSGKAEFNGAVLDVATNGEFLPKGTLVEVVALEGLRILVSAAQEE
ncbi:MAG TPA: NfeD family protein [Clostridia bacterium]|nr:NfeD family protein [Clostridia bacterium]